MGVEAIKAPSCEESDSCYDGGAPLFVSFPDLGAYDLSQKQVCSKTKLLPDRQPHGLGTQRESCKN